MIANKKNLVWIKFAICVLMLFGFSQLGVCKDFHEMVLMDTSEKEPDTFSFSPDGKWVVLFSYPVRESFEKALLEPLGIVDIDVINLETGAKLDVQYIDTQPAPGEGRFMNYWFFWRDNTNLTFIPGKRNVFYNLEIKESKAVCQRTVVPKNVKIPFSNPSLSQKYYDKGMPGDMEKLAKELPELTFKRSNNKETLFYKGKEVVTYAPKTIKSDILQGEETEVLPYVSSLSVSPDNRYVFFALAWDPPAMLKLKTHLHLFDTSTNKIIKVDENFAWDFIDMMAWSPDSKKFIYWRHTNPRGNRPNEIVELKF